MTMLGLDIVSIFRTRFVARQTGVGWENRVDEVPEHLSLPEATPAILRHSKRGPQGSFRKIDGVAEPREDCQGRLETR